MEDTASGIRGSMLVAEFEDGSSTERTVLLPKGDAANPFSWDDMRRKLVACMRDLHMSQMRLLKRFGHLIFQNSTTVSRNCYNENSKNNRRSENFFCTLYIGK